MSHVVLLGDSIFDNKAYVGSDPDVQTQLHQKLASQWKTTLLAVDGDKIHDVHNQLKRLPSDATHLVISIGGNNVLGEIHLMQRTVNFVAEALEIQATIGEDFEKQYRTMVQSVRTLGLPFTLCTIYYPNYPDRLLNRLGSTGLTIFNDSIIRIAVEAGVPLIDLRLVCNDPADYANPIEPSAKGGEKITTVIQRVLENHNFSERRTAVYF